MDGGLKGKFANTPLLLQETDLDAFVYAFSLRFKAYSLLKIEPE